MWDNRPKTQEDDLVRQQKVLETCLKNKKLNKRIKKQLKKVRMQMVPNMLIKGKDLKSHNDYAPIYSYMHTNSQKSKEKIKKLY